MRLDLRTVLRAKVVLDWPNRAAGEEGVWAEAEEQNWPPVRITSSQDIQRVVRNTTWAFRSLTSWLSSLTNISWVEPSLGGLRRRYSSSRQGGIMSGLSRTVVRSENIPIADILFIQRELFLAKGDLQRAQTLEKACYSVCDHPSPINTAQEAKKLRNVGSFVASFLEPFFVERHSAPPVQPASQEPSVTNMTGRNAKAKRKYCPAKHSGGYALLITLLRAHQSGKVFMKKQELIDEADKSGLSNKPIRPNALSWTGGRPNSRELYSGWSSMKQLTEKCLVAKSSNPAKYKLTEEGMRLAQECLDRSGFSQDNNPEQETEEEPIVRPSPQESGEFGPGSQACSSSDDDIQEIRRSDSRDRNNLLFTSLQAPMRGDGINDASSQRNTSGNANLQSAPVAPPAVSQRNPLENASQRSAPVAPRTASLPRAANVDLLRNEYADNPVRATNVQGNARVEIGAVDPDFQLAVPPLEAGEKFSDVYEVICILDNREKFRATTGNAQTLLNKFSDSLRAQFKIKIEARCLPVGDAIWIARHKQTIEEYALDFLVERKNVTDLWQSIKDGRYKKQKLRMMNCGLQVLLYLVEGDVNNVDATVSADSLKTALFTTELHGGFRVLRTDDTHDTCKQYGHLTLSIIRRYDMEKGQGGRSGRVCKTFKDFVEHCKEFQKNRVKDVFCCQLTQIGQVTEDIALSIQEKYPTLFSLVQAYIELEGNQGSQEKILQGIPIRNTAKTISAVMSRNIYKAIWAP